LYFLPHLVGYFTVQLNTALLGFAYAQCGCRVYVVLGKFVPQGFSNVGQILGNRLFVLGQWQLPGFLTGRVAILPLGWCESVVVAALGLTCGGAFIGFTGGCVSARRTVVHGLLKTRAGL
jgi:hypothetical protein